jgi:hypothetical protein
MKFYYPYLHSIFTDNQVIIKITNAAMIRLNMYRICNLIV